MCLCTHTQACAGTCTRVCTHTCTGTHAHACVFMYDTHRPRARMPSRADLRAARWHCRGSPCEPHLAGSWMTCAAAPDSPPSSGGRRRPGGPLTRWEVSTGPAELSPQGQAGPSGVGGAGHNVGGGIPSIQDFLAQNPQGPGHLSFSCSGKPSLTQKPAFLPRPIPQRARDRVLVGVPCQSPVWCLLLLFS